jgi:hypothetical protein
MMMMMIKKIMSTLCSHYECRIRMHALVSCQNLCLVNKNQTSFVLSSQFTVCLSLAEICVNCHYIWSMSRLNQISKDSFDCKKT